MRAYRWPLRLFVPAMVDKADFSWIEKGQVLRFVTPEQMRSLEEGASGYGLGVRDLMENAGRGVADYILRRFGTPRVCVVCGAGNNGGDGLVAARFLSRRCVVSVLLLATPGDIRTEEARGNWEELTKAKATIHVTPDKKGLMGRAMDIAEAEVVVAAMFGTGVRGETVREPYATAIRLVNESRGAKVAIDIPSGLDPATGRPSDPTVRADITLALHLPKAGLRGNVGFTGEIVVVPIGIRGAPP
jgi:hydroxyethylthiazole kinase-like uncharacterized protein yjeF